MESFLTGAIRKYAGRVDYLEVRLEEAEGTGIAFRGPNLDSLQSAMSRGGFARALKKGGWGLASFTSYERIEHFIEEAIRQAELVGRGVTRLAPAAAVRRKIPLHVKKDPRRVPLQRKIDILQNYNRLILDHDARIPTSSVGYSDSYRRKVLANSEGTYLEWEKVDLGCNLVPIAVKDGNTQMGSVGIGSSDDFDVMLGRERELEEACRHAVALLEAPGIKGGVYPLVLDPVLAGVFVHEAFGHMSEADKVYENERLAEIMKIGARFGEKQLNIYDSGLVPGSRGALAFDDEGVPARTTWLIRDGELVGRLHTRETAGRMGEEATGNARAVSYRFPPIPRMRVTCIDNGETPFNEMIAGIELGVYACDAFGGQAGEMFTFTAGRGYMIRNGKIEEMVRDVTISGNLFTTLRNIDCVGNDFRIHEAGGGCGRGSQFPLPVAHGAPSIRIREAVIGGK